jgi:SAM-dependent methyltransferase
MNKIQDYYNNPKKYLKEHESFLLKAKTKEEVMFIIKALNLKKSERILDIACGQGRHVHQFVKAGYKVDGVDFSKTLLKKAQELNKTSKDKNSNFVLSDIKNFEPRITYDKAYWFFADLANMDPDITIKSLKGIIKNNGLILLDFDNIFRLKKNLKKNRHNELSFDNKNSILTDNEYGFQIPYLKLSKWKKIFKKNNFYLYKLFGNYNLNKYNQNSPRLIMIIKKTA